MYVLGSQTFVVWLLFFILFFYFFFIFSWQFSIIFRNFAPL